MATLQLLSNIYIGIIWFVIALFLLVLFFRMRAILTGKQKRTPLFSVKGNWYPKILKIVIGFAMFCAILNAFFVLFIASSFKSIIPAHLNQILFIVVLFTAIWELYLSFSISDSLLNKRSKRIWLTVVLILVAPLSFLFAYSIPDMVDFPSVENSNIIEFPAEEVWLAVHAGGNEIVNIHNTVKCQLYAIDMVKVNETGEFYRNDGNELEDHFCYNETIYAPADGEIVAVVDSLENKPISLSPNEYTSPAGNHAVIKIKDSSYIFLCHLNKGSLLVKEGDLVKAGDPIGKVGNSGNTSWPHLHIHLQDLPILDYKNATGKPFRFAKLNRKRWIGWQEVNNAAVTRNDLMRK